MAISLDNNNQNDGNDFALDAVDISFFNEINNDITIFGQLPYNIPKALIVNCIIDAAKYFFEWHPRVDRPAFYLVDVNHKFINELIEHDGPSYKKGGVTLPMDPSISVVRKIHENKNTFGFQDMIDENYSNSTIGNRSSTTGINSNMFFTEIATKMVEINMINSILGTTIAFRFNQFDNTLYLKTLPKSETVLIECKAKVHIHNLYRNPYFKRLVLGYSKRHLKRLIGGHTFELPGGVTLNADEICNNLDDIETVEALIKASSSAGNLILER